MKVIHAPFYEARSQQVCPACGVYTPVITLGVSKLVEEDGKIYDSEELGIILCSNIRHMSIDLIRYFSRYRYFCRVYLRDFDEKKSRTGATGAVSVFPTWTKYLCMRKKVELFRLSAGTMSLRQ